MNITLVENHIVFGNYGNDGETVDISDQIGFSTANLDEGFNNFGDTYDDGANNYPLIEEAALIIYAYFNPYNASAIPAPISGDVVRAALIAPAPNYEGVAWDLELDVSVGEGWYTLECTLLDAAAAAPGAIPYYNTTDSTIRDATDAIITADALEAIPAAGTISIQKWFTPLLDALKNEKAAILADIGMDNGECSGPCSKAYNKALKDATYVKSLVDGAEKYFNAGSQNRAQQIVTYIQENL